VNTLVTAEHGSWDSATLQGYRLTFISINAATNTPVYASFAAGFLDTHNAPCGSPVDVEVFTDGSLLVSDDQNGAIYKITYG
jgi:glucose/arabinose dehydrogenase